MADFGLPEWESIIDKMAAMVDILDPALGEAADASSAAKGAQNIVDVIAGTTDELRMEQLIAPSRDLVDKVSTLFAVPALMDIFFLAVNRALEGIDLWWEAEHTPSATHKRILPQFAWVARAVGIPFRKGDAIESGKANYCNVAPPVTILGSAVVTGAASCTYTDGANIDQNLYGDTGHNASLTASLEIEILGGSLGAASSFDVYVKYIDQDNNDAEEVTTKTTINSDTVGDKFDVTINTGDTGVFDLDESAGCRIEGAQGDTTVEFRIQTKVDRTPSI